MSSVLQVKNSAGTLIDVPALRGKSAYECAVDEGFEGTKEEWVATLGGIPGNGIKSMVQTTTSTTSSGKNVFTFTDDENNKATFTVYNGSKGDKGTTPNLTIGTVSTLAAGTNATANISGTAENPVLNLGIPRGATGASDTTAASGNTSNKIFLIGRTSQSSTGGTTYSHDTAYVGTDGYLYSNAIQVVNLSDTQNLTNKTYNGYTLADACAKGVADSTSATAIGTSSNLVTERDVYYGLPKLNGSHTYNSSHDYYAPTTVGTSGQILYSNGSGAPSWQNAPTIPSISYGTDDLTAGSSPLTTGALYFVYE